MVVMNKEEARAEFSKNLNKELDRLGAPKRGRPEWLRKKLNEVVSRETCRKWLSGKDLPDQPNMSILIDRLSLNQQLLRTGRWEPAPGGKDARLTEVQKAWPHLSEKIRAAILSMAQAGTPETATETPIRRRRRQS